MRILFLLTKRGGKNTVLSQLCSLFRAATQQNKVILQSTYCSEGIATQSPHKTFVLTWASSSHHFTDFSHRVPVNKRILQQKLRSSFCLQKPFIQIKMCCFLFISSISSTFWRKFGKRCAKKTNSTDQRRWCDDNF